MRAMALARAARQRMVALRAALRAGTVDPVELLRGNEPMWEDDIRRMRVARVLKMIPHIGPRTTAEALALCGLHEDTRLGHLGFGSRYQLADLIEDVLHPDRALAKMPVEDLKTRPDA